MPNNPDLPFDHDTLKIRAVFVPDSAKDQHSPSAVTSALGYDAVKIPAVFVREGGMPPGYPYQHVGRAEFRRDEAAGKRRLPMSSTASSQTPDAAQGDREAQPILPRTRYRFGAALPGGSPGLPPNPALPGAHDHPARTATGILRGIARATRAFAAQHARRTPGDAPATTSPDASPDPSRPED